MNGPEPAIRKGFDFNAQNTDAEDLMQQLAQIDRREAERQQKELAFYDKLLKLAESCGIDVKGITPEFLLQNSRTRSAIVVDVKMFYEQKQAELAAAINENRHSGEAARQAEAAYQYLTAAHQNKIIAYLPSQEGLSAPETHELLKQVATALDDSKALIDKS